jgi:RNA polymerase sigma-70 factor (ECF subfamily)
VTADDRSWFEPLVRTFEKPAFQFAQMMIQDRAAAEEIVQEAFARVWASPRTPREPDDFRRWLYRTLINLLRDHHRRQMLESKLRFWDHQPADPQEEAMRRSEDQELMAAIRSLRLRERQAIYLHYYDEQPFAEIGRILEMQETAARVMVHRSLAKLRARLKGSETMTREVPA